MKHIVIGTAGHIDHGKTQLIRTLTDRETDTLKEEKKRGISINLGFTYFDLPSGKRAGIIDVPGHEKFIKNMLAGAMGIDVVLLVIAADEGVMPQTKEHLEILQLLGVKRGIVVITKTDLVDDEWISMIKSDVVEEIKETFLKDAPFVSVSSKTKEGIDELTEILDTIVEEVDEKDLEGYFRLPVDRTFTISGFGTVVTGTIISGSIKINDELVIYPEELKTKVRGIQVHGEKSEIAEAGQRCAINLMNIKKEDIRRGDIISIPSALESTYIVDAKLLYLKSAKSDLENRQRIRFYSGTSEIMGRVVLLDKEQMKPGESGFVQIRLEDRSALQRGDRFIIRNYSPMYTIGGGVIIEPNGEKAKRFDGNYIENLEIKTEGSIEEIVGHTIEKISLSFPNKDDIIKASGKNIDNIYEILSELQNKSVIFALTQSGKTNYVHKKYIKDLEIQINKILEDFHKKSPLEIGISKEELKTKLFSKTLKNKIYGEILKQIQVNGTFEIKGNYVCQKGFEIKLTSEQNDIKNDILNIYKNAKFAPPKFKALTEGKRNVLEYKKLYELLIKNGDMVKISQDIVLIEDNYEQGKKKVVKFLEKNGKISLVDVRQELDTTRQYAVAFLEHLDEIKITKRDGNERTLV